MVSGTVRRLKPSTVYTTSIHSENRRYARYHCSLTCVDVLPQDDIEHQKKADHIVDTVLNLMDKDNDGKINLAELKAVGLDGLPNFEDLGAEGHHYDVESGAYTIYSLCGYLAHFCCSRVLPAPRG